MLCGDRNVSFFLFPLYFTNHAILKPFEEKVISLDLRNITRLKENSSVNK